ncbi:hypothetical protein [uncultured Mobiluncus sp.]|uniref:hypothetical protein n=1 Tax=uncultured Mobiluncus sp. TaxID=293425 RepID=UPI00262ED0DB|nr:hypothetical protein [uncultured Mobiluncus sp.]
MSSEMGALRAGGAAWAGAFGGVDCTTDRFQKVYAGLFLIANCVFADRDILPVAIGEVWEVKSVVRTYTENRYGEYELGMPGYGQKSGLGLQ